LVELIITINNINLIAQFHHSKKLCSYEKLRMYTLSEPVIADMFANILLHT